MMKRWSVTFLVLALCSAGVHADVTIVQKTTIEGGAAAAMAGAGVTPPTVTNRIKGGKGRTDLDMGSGGPVAANVSTITDTLAAQVIILDHNQKTARIATPGSRPPAAAPVGTVKVDSSLTPTGKTRTIDGFRCDEYAFSTSLSVSEFGGGQMPPEAAAMMKDMIMVMKGSIWVTKDAPGIAEYRQFQKALSSSDLTSAAMAASGLNMPGAEKLTRAMQGIDGLPVLTELSMSISGGTGEMAEMMKQMMGDTKVVTRVLSVRTDAIGDDAFKVPAGYQIIK